MVLNKIPPLLLVSMSVFSDGSHNFPQLVQYLENSPLQILQHHGAVSYTHLDVYKRQNCQ